MKKLFHLLKLGCLLLILALMIPTQDASALQSSVCDYYVDNRVSSDGDGSWDHPWNDINDHLGDLLPGDTMCVRGDTVGSGQEYEVTQIDLDSEGGQVYDGTPESPIVVRAYPGEKVILRNVGSDPTVSFKGADYWVFEGFVIDNNGRNGWTVLFEQNANYNTLRNNEIYNGNGNGVRINDDHNVGNVIESNHIHHFDAGEQDAHCISLTPGSDNTIIRGNVIHDCSGDGVHIFALDETPISEYSKGVQIVDNVLYRGTLPRSEDGFDFKGADGLVATGNEFYGYYYDSDRGVPGRAIVVQKGSRNLLFDGNIIHDAGDGINCHSEGGKHVENITLTNNLFYNIDDRYVITFVGVYEATVYHNTIADSNGYSLLVEGLHNSDIRNNLIYNSGEAVVTSGTSFDNVTVGYNGWFNAEAESDFTASTDKVGSSDPGFVDAANDDYHLTVNSVVRDAGVDVGLATDFEGDVRPFGDGPDIGADEHVPTAPYLKATPGDGTIHLFWSEFWAPDLIDYTIAYTYGVGGSDADQGPSPILGIPPSTVRLYVLTGVTNYVFYTVTVEARNENGGTVNLAVSNSVRVMPTDIFFYLPMVMRMWP